MSQLLGVQHVDPFAVESPSSLSDWTVPVSFMKGRHSYIADSKDSKANHDSWRVKDRVCANISQDSACTSCYYR